MTSNLAEYEANANLFFDTLGSFLVKNWNFTKVEVKSPADTKTAEGAKWRVTTATWEYCDMH